MSRFLPLLVVATTLRAVTPALSAQLVGVPAEETPSYGYQPYNPSTSTGFYHPNGMGYGSYVNPTKLKGHRSPSLSYRRFKGY